MPEADTLLCSIQASSETLAFNQEILSEAESLLNGAKGGAASAWNIWMGMSGLCRYRRVWNEWCGRKKDGGWVNRCLHAWVYLKL